jgi:hypothetical protein
VTDELFRLERALAERDHAAVRGGLGALLDPDFLEFGSSGRTWDRAETIEALLPQAAPGPLDFRDWTARPLAEGVVLVTYTLSEASHGGWRTTRRSSVWHARDGRWQLLFHQGTPVEESTR